VRARPYTPIIWLETTFGRLRCIQLRPFRNLRAVFFRFPPSPFLSIFFIRVRFRPPIVRFSTGRGRPRNSSLFRRRFVTRPTRRFIRVSFFNTRSCLVQRGTGRIGCKNNGHDDDGMCVFVSSPGFYRIWRVFVVFSPAQTHKVTVWTRSNFFSVLPRSLRTAATQKYLRNERPSVGDNCR